MCIHLKNEIYTFILNLSKHAHPISKNCDFSIIAASPSKIQITLLASTLREKMVCNRVFENDVILLMLSKKCCIYDISSRLYLSSLYCFLYEYILLCYT